MTKHHRISIALATGMIGVAGALGVVAARPDRAVNGTIWSANRFDHTIRGFDAATGALVRTVAMTPGSQPGDLAYARGKLYVAEEQGAAPAIAIVNPETGETYRIPMAVGSRPHHVHASPGGDLVAVGLYGTDRVAVVDTADDALLGLWDSNPNTTTGRVHAAVFSQDGNTLYLANEGANEIDAMDPRTGFVFWRLTVPGIHELAITHNGKTAYVTRRSAGQLAVIDLENRTYHDVVPLPLPDTLRLTPNEKVLTVGLRNSPAQLAVVDTITFTIEVVVLSPDATSIAGHQWTSRNGKYTFASYEGGSSQGIAVIDHDAGHAIVQRLSYPGRPHGVEHVLP